MNNLITAIRKCTEAFMKQSLWKRVVMVLSCFVVFGTTYMLILPAITLERTEADQQGGINFASDINQDYIALSYDGEIADAEGDIDDVPQYLTGVQTSVGLDYVVTVDVPESAQIPNNAYLAVDEVSEEEYKIYSAQAMKALGVDSMSFARFFDIRFEVETEEGVVEVQPQDTVNVCIDTGTAATEKEVAAVLHYNDSGETAELASYLTDRLSEEEFAAIVEDGLTQDELETFAAEKLNEEEAAGLAMQGMINETVNAVESEDADDTGEVPEEDNALTDKVYYETPELLSAEKNDVQIVFDTAGFSVFGVVYTVDFRYEIDGQEYTYSMDGGNSIKAEDLFVKLGIVADETAAAEFVGNVADISFSNPDLLAVTRVDQDTTIFEIEDNIYNALYSENSGEDFFMEGDTDVPAEDIVVIAPTWVLTSLAPFDSDETLGVTMNDGERFTIDVKDEQHNPAGGEWALEHPGVTSSFTPSISSSVTEGEQSRNVTFNLNLDYQVSSGTLADMQSYVGYPTLTYDLRDWLQHNPVDINSTSGRLRSSNGTTIGTYTIGSDGLVQLKITNLTWLKVQNRLEGNVTMSLTVNEEDLGADDKWEFRVPGSPTPFEIEFEEIHYNTSKNVDFNGQDRWDGAYIEKDSDGNYYMNYTATFNSPAKLERLEFFDTLSSNQQLVGNVTVTNSAGQTLNTHQEPHPDGFKINIDAGPPPGTKLESGTYTVSYRTKLTAEAVQQLEGGNYATNMPATNDSAWKVNGNKDVDGPSTEIHPKKDPPQPEPPVKKVNGKTGDAGKFTYGQTLNYTLTYGSDGISLQGTTISDTMSALQKLNGTITMTYGNNQTMTLNPSGTWGSSSFQYGTDGRQLFSYTFNEDVDGPVTITYSTTVLTENDAKALNLFGTQDVSNTFIAHDNSSYTVGHVDTQEPTEVKKTVTNTNGSETYKPGDTVTYVVEYGKSGEDMSGVILYDRMTDIQRITTPITITSGNGQTVTLSSGASGYKWNDDNSYSTNYVNVLEYTVPNGMTGIITVTYNATIIDEETGNKAGLWGNQPLNNNASTSKRGNDDTHKDVDYGKKPVPTVEKNAFNQTAANEGREQAENWKPGDVINWTVTYNMPDNKDMNGMHLEDFMNYLQTYNHDAQISINGGNFTTMPSSYITYDSAIVNQPLGVNNRIKVYDFYVHESQKVTSIVITYSTTIIDGSTALANDIANTQKVYNEGIGEGVPDKEEHDTDFPEVPIDKDVTEQGGTESIDGGTWAPGDEVTYKMTYGASGMKLNEAWVHDEMTDVQVLTGDVLITYHDAQGGSHSYTMPNASDNDGSGVNYTDDHRYSLYENPSVFDYYLPKADSSYGEIYGPIEITYNATIIDAETAKNNNIGGQVTVGNKFSTKFGADNTTGFVPYTPNSHDGDIEKTAMSMPDGTPVFEEGVEGAVNNVDYNERTVTWVIKVDKKADSAFPLSNVEVKDDYAQYAINGVYGDAIPERLIDFNTADIITESGVTLSPGVDYTVELDNQGIGYIRFTQINEPVYIYLKEVLPKDIVGVYFFMNRVYLNTDGGDDDDTYRIDGNNDDVVVSKSGEFDENTKTIKWTVVLNPAKVSDVGEDWGNVLFRDYLPEGLTFVNYTDHSDTEHPTVYVEYDGDVIYSGQGYNKEVDIESKPDGYFEANLTAYDEGWQYRSYEQLIQGGYDRAYNSEHTDSKTIQELIEYVENGGSPHIYTQVYIKTVKAGISRQKYIVTYYTTIASEEWKQITSSATGSKTYENDALFTDGGTNTVSGSGEETVKVKSPLTKLEVYDANEGMTGEEPDWHIIEDNSQESRDRYYWYQLDINADEELLNNGAPMKLMDYLDPKIDLIPTSIQIMEVTEQGERDTSGYAADVKPKPSYNDDNRMLTVENLQDSTHYILRYRVRVRALYTPDMDLVETGTKEYVIPNYATLEGGNTWSETIKKEHKTEVDAASIMGGIQLVKIDENDPTTVLPDAVFELYECETGIEITYDHDHVVQEINTDNMLEEFVMHQVLDYKYDVNGQIVGEDHDEDGSNYTYTSKADGAVDFGSNLKENTLYCWIEKQFPTGYLGDTGTPHYFVIYYEDANLGITESRRNTAWELDEIWQDHYGIRAASVSGGTVWVATNSKTRSIRVTKRWEGDSDNAYNTRPESIKVNLIQIKEDGTRRVFDSATLAPDTDGTWQRFTNYSWSNLPASYEEDGKLKHYKYTCEEEFVQGYIATYSDNQEGINTGTITVYNTLIPSKVDLCVEKVWEGDDIADRPNFIEVQLMRILTDVNGNKGTPKNIGDPVRIMRGTDGKWTYKWIDLPTKDGEGGTYTYTVKEVTVPEGYAVKYSDNNNGTLLTTPENPLTITNTALGNLEVSKAFNGLNYTDLTSAQMRAITFDVIDSNDKVVANFSLYDMLPSLKKRVENIPVGEYTVRENAPEGSIPDAYEMTTEVSVEDGKTTVVKGEDASVTFTNTYTRKPVDFEFTKIWKNQDGTGYDAWVKDIDVVLYRKAKKLGAAEETVSLISISKTGEEGSEVVTATANPELEITVTEPEAGSESDGYIFKITNLPADDEDRVEYEYYVREREVDGYETSYALADGTTPIEILSEAKDDGKIVNTPQNAVALPMTGGHGLTKIYMLGTILALFAGALLLARKLYSEKLLR